MKSYFRLTKFAYYIKGELTKKILISLMISITYIAQAFSMANAVTLVFQGMGMQDIFSCAVSALLCIVLRSTLARYLEGYDKVIGAKIKNEIRLRVFDQILRLGPGYLSSRRTGRLQSLVLDGIESLEPFLVSYLPQMISICISALSIGIYLFTLDYYAGSVSIVAMLLCIVIPYLTVPIVWVSIVSYWRSYAVLNAQYIDSIQGMPTLMAFNASSTRGEQLSREAHDFYTKQIRNTAFSLMDSAIMLIFTALSSSVTVAVAAIRTDSGMLPATLIPTFLFLSAECARPMLELNKAWHSSFLGLSTAEEIFSIIDTELTVVEKEQADCAAMEEGLPSISLENVDFCYPNGKEDALKALSLTIAPGQTVAIVGKSGSGKSTFLNLLLRFYDPSAGSIAINGVELRDYGLEYLRSKIAVVFQDTYLFNDSVLENIRISRPRATLDEVVAAAQAAGAHAFISNLPNGYDTIIGERGIDLSGGERQRISIARAIIKNAPILVLDEATSSVDAASEAVIQKTMDTLAIGRTTILIAHRLSTVQNADKIFVLDEGNLVEQGTHRELLEINGVYADLVRAQWQEDNNG